jgi:hypothetical protein
MRTIVGVDLHIAAKVRVQVPSSSEEDRGVLVVHRAGSRRRVGRGLVWAKLRGPSDPIFQIRSPELQRVTGDEFDPSVIRDSNELPIEQPRSGLVEPPVGQGDAWIDPLQLSLEIQQVGSVPREKADEPMAL